MRNGLYIINYGFDWFMQNVTMRVYKAPFSLTCLVCFIGTLQSIAVTFVMEHKPNVWSIGWDMNLLAAAYAVCISLSLYLSRSFFV